ncbi:testis-expressed protein 15 isoform X2 [Rhineura floridana]|nr:testis-expressed protein 15 isoform X2 [Rhineura floridana]
MEVIRKNVASNTKGLFLSDQNPLKKFTIPKRAPDKGFLTECSTNQRDYSEIIQRLSQSCLDTECNLESLWQFDKIEMVHNKDLEEDFVAKRAKLREEGRQDKEVSGFLIVPKDEVSKICQSGLHIGHSTKNKLNIVKELGNPQLGVYLFRYVEVALNYASKHSIPVENIIIFRVLLGKVKKIQPPKGKKKVALDPTPNFDCHMSRIHPSVKDSLEDQAISSLVYFYEYNELSKPVEKPRQCLPYAVIKVKCVNQKMEAVSPVASSKCRPQKLPKHVGRGRSLPLENCTRVTRIGKSQLIYEHFRKPIESCAVNLQNNASAEVSPFSGSLQNWSGSIAETQCRKMKPKSSERWDSAQMETNETNLQYSPYVDVCRDVRSTHTENANKNPLKTHPGVSPACDSGSSTVLTSRLIKDPRLTKREQNLGKQNAEAIFDGFSQCENEMEYNLEMKISAAVGSPYTVSEDFFLLNSKYTFNQRQYMEKTSWEESTLKESVAASLLNRDRDYSVNSKQGLSNINKSILRSQNADTDHSLKTNLSHSSLKFKTSKAKNPNRILMEDVKAEKEIKHLKLSSLQQNPSKTLVNERKFQDKNPESVTSSKDKMDNTGKIGNQLQGGYASEMLYSADLDTKCAQKNCTSSEEEHNGNVESCNFQDNTLQSEFCQKLHVSENMRENRTEENYRCEWSSDDQMGAEMFEQNECHATIESENFNMAETPKEINKQIYATPGITNSSVREKEECTTKKMKDTSFKERIMHQSHNACRTDPVIRDCDEKSVCPPESESLEKNILGDSKQCCLSLGIFVDEQRHLETDDKVNANGFNQIHISDLEEASPWEEKGGIYTPEIQIPSTTENAAERTSGKEKENYVKTDMKKSISVIKHCTEVSENFGDLDSENSIDLTPHQKKNHTISMLSTSIHVPLGDREHTEIKKSQAKNTGTSNANFEVLKNNLSCTDSIPEIFEQDLGVKCEDNNIQDLEVFSEIENALEGSKKYLSISQNPCSHGNILGEKDEYHYLQERMDWENLFQKPSLSTKVSDNPSVKENENGVEETELINTYLCPDLQITITNIYKPKLNSFHSSYRTNTDTGKCAAKYLSHKKGIKGLQDKKNEKYIKGWKTSNFYHRGKEHNISDEQCICSSLSKGQVKTFVQSEKYIKNILNTLNTEALFCKNKHLSQKIDGAMFHLRKARWSVQKSLKILAKARRKRQSDSSKSCKVIHCGSQYLDYSVTSGCISDIPGSSDNVRNTKITELETVFEKSTSLDTMEFKNTKITTDKHIMSNEEKTYVNLTSENYIQENVATNIGWTKQDFSSEADRCKSKNSAKHVNSVIERKEWFVNQADKRKSEGTCESDINASTIKLATPVQTAVESSAKPDDISSSSPIFTVLENVFSNENEALEISPVQQKNMNMSAGISSNSYLLSPMPLVDNSLFLSSHNHELQDFEGEKTEEMGISKTKTDFSNIKFPVKPLVKIDLEQKDMTQASHFTPSKETACRFSSVSVNKVIQLHSNFQEVPEQNVEPITATTIFPPAHYYDSVPNKTNKKSTNSRTRLNEICCSAEHSNNCRDLSDDIKCPKVGIELKSLDFIIKISEILRKADETTSLNILHEHIMSCRNSLPFFLRAFEKKQECSFERVLVSREILRNAERKVQAVHKLKPCAIESLIELQIIMETIEFIENKKRLIEGEPTFRSLLWYDDSLFSELFGGQSGYQQQSNLYPAFQRRLKYSALNELQSYHKQLVEAFENTRWENNSYYSFLKLRREIEECEAAIKSNSNLSDFFLSVPYVCGANYGDTLEDLEHARKNTMDLINTYETLPEINGRAEKEDNIWVIMEIIATKVEFIKTCEDVNIKTSLYGLEHIFFDTAKSLAWKEREKFINRDLKDGKRQMLKLNEAALSKLYDTYQNMVEEFENGSCNSAIEEHILKESSGGSCNCEMADRQHKANYYITKSLIVRQDICCIGEILDEAQASNIERLQQLTCRCMEHMEMLKKYFQILQEEDVSVLITKENVLGFMKSGGISPVILKPEAVEVYTEMAMIYETVFFLKNSIARKKDKPRFRSLLWFDESLLPELFRCQEKMASLSYRKDNLLKMIESSICELQDELNVIYDYAENLNCSYALHLLTRELAEFSETRNLLQTSKSSISMCVDLVPYSICLNYGSTVSELECNYNQFSSLLEKLMLAEKKDLGKMAHIMKIMKTIEHMKFVCSEQGKSPLPLVIYQMLKNWRKTCQLKRQDTKMHVDIIEEHNIKDSMCSSGSRVCQASGSQSQHKRPANVSSEDNPGPYEEKSDPSHSKKKKVAASLMTTTKNIHEKETSRNLRKSGKYNFPKDKELQLSISTDNIWNKKVDDLRETSPISHLQIKDLKAVCPFASIHSSPNISDPKLICSNILASQQNLADLRDFNKNSWSAKEHEEYLASHNERDKDVSLSSMKVQLLQQCPEGSVNKDGSSSTLNEHHDLKSESLGDASHECSTALCLPPNPRRNEGKCGEKTVIPNCTTTYNLDSSTMMEVKSVELEHLQLGSSYSENNKKPAELSAFSQNEHLEETSQLQCSSVHIYGTVHPYYSWYFCQTGSNSHSVIQAYQELNSYEMHQLTYGMSAATSIMYNTQSSMFHSQSYSHFSVGESQRFNFAQMYPMYGYVSSVVGFPCNNYQQPLWYAENQPLAHVAFPYPSNIGSQDYVDLQ